MLVFYPDFKSSGVLVYGFVPHCTQATLFGDLSGQEIKTMVSTTELQKTKGTFLHKLTARAIIRDYEDGILGNSEAEHEGKKAELKSYITELSEEFSILSQFTSFVAIEERDQNELDTGFTDIPKIISEEDVDILPYMGWTEEKLKAAYSIGAEDDDMESEELSSSSSTYHDLDMDCMEGHIWNEMSSEIGHCEMEDAEGSSNYFIERSAAPPEPQLISRSYASCSSTIQSPSHSESSIDVFIGSSRRSANMDVFGITAPKPYSGRATALDLSGISAPKSHRRRAAAPTVSAIKSIPSSMSDRPPLHAAVMPPYDSSIRDEHPFYCTAAVPSFLQYPPIFASADSLSRDDSLPPVGASVQSTSSMYKRRPILHASSAHVIQFAGPPDSTHLASTRSMFTTPLPPPPPPSSMMAAVPAFYSQLHFPPTFSDCSSSPTILSESLSLCSSSVGHFFEASRQQQAQQQQEVLQDVQLQEQQICLSSMSSAPAADSFTFDFDTSRYKKKRGKRVKASLARHFAPPHDSLPKMRRKYDTVAWNELFELQDKDGYWECTDRLSSFLNLDVDFFANVFLKEKGIRSFGVKAHADILRLVATLLVLQLIRVKKLAVGQLLESLLRLKESQEPRPMYWEAVKRAVAWACRTDRQHPCVCSRLEIGRDWESSTRQLLGCDSPHPYSPLKPVLERRMDVSVM
ncbi:poly [ADP-ribose] polymerase 4-like [Sinocyclocheilus anshuiensis]|uniref:poly [ADP-ribose] polymerase 4-like n=1 Tax=Sinocyclocheilus anshuiensis TaxID=1608454 RepID=UPI0007B9418D|nr:PREDICTED: poly [ADP-ribose] polymerase 4-like [Sinocyclocheilus anshuiensis]